MKDGAEQPAELPELLLLFGTANKTVFNQSTQDVALAHRNELIAFIAALTLVEMTLSCMKIP